MIDQIHQHILAELKTNTQTDRIFVLSAISLNLITLIVNSVLASSGDETSIIVLFIFVALILVVNIVAEVGLIKGKQTRTQLLTGLISMYKDNGVDQYYDSGLLKSYEVRYNLFMLIVLLTGVIAILVPFVVM
jgi:hypothetical protein